MAKKSRRKTRRERSGEPAGGAVTPSVADGAPATSGGAPVVALFLASAGVAAMAVLPNGPLAFLTPTLSWALVAAAVGAWWFPLLPAVNLDPARRVAHERLLEGVGVVLVFGTYLLLKLTGMRDTNTDDNIYFYFAQRMADGAVPYRDFFFAHPPVHLLIPAFAFELFGYSAGLAKSLPVLAQGAAAVCLYLALRPASRTLALLAVALQLTAYEILMGATHLNGENIMTMFLMAALLAATRRRFILAGSMAGLSLGTGFYVLAGVLGLGVAVLRDGRRSLGRFALGLGATFGGLFAAFWAIGGRSFLEGVVYYHLRKPLKGDTRLSVLGAPDPLSAAGALLHNTSEFLGGREFTQSLFYHSGLYVAGAIGVVFAARAVVRALGETRPGEGSAEAFGAEGLALAGGGAAALFVLQFAALSEIYSYYMVPMLALLSIPAAFGLLEVHRRMALAEEGSHGWVAGAGLIAFGLHTPVSRSLHDSLWPDQVASAGQVVRYEWRDPIVFPSIARLSKALFFEDHRVKGLVEPAYRHYVWNKLLTFSTAGEVAAHVREHSTPDETLTGSSTYAPLVALLAGRRISADEADTNTKRFTSGQTTEEEFFRKVCADKVRFILAAPNSWFDERVLGERGVVARHFVRDREFLDPQAQHRGEKRLVLYRRIEPAGAPLPAGSVCAP